MLCVLILACTTSNAPNAPSTNNPDPQPASQPAMVEQNSPAEQPTVSGEPPTQTAPSGAPVEMPKETDIKALVQKGELLKAQQQLEAFFANPAGEISPVQMGQVLTTAAEVSYYQDLPGKACTFYKKAFVEDPQLIDTHISFAVLECMKDNATPDQMSAWIDSLTTASSVAKQEAHLQRLVFDLNIETERKDMSDPDFQKVEQLTNAISNQPTVSQRLLAESYVLLEEWDKALPLLDKVGNSEPFTWDAQVMSLGALLIRFEQGKKKEALAAMDVWRDRQDRWEGLHYGMIGGGAEALELIRYVQYGLPIRTYERTDLLYNVAQTNGIRPRFEASILQELLKKLPGVWPSEPEQTVTMIEQFLLRIPLERGCVIKRRLLQPEVIASLFDLRAQALEKLDKSDMAKESRQKGQSYRLISK